MLRAIPLLVLLVIVYYALPFVGLRLPPFWAATAALSLVASAYIAETFRAGIEAVPAGQVEAARALGLSWPRMMTDIVLPQAIRFTIPPGTGIAISLIKDTALASVVAMPDLLKQATQAQAYYANPTPLIGAAMLYLLLLLPLVRVVSAIENRAPAAGEPDSAHPTLPRAAGRRRSGGLRTRPCCSLRRWKTLRRLHRAGRHRPGRGPWRGHRPHRPVRVRQVDAGALREPAGNL